MRVPDLSPATRALTASVNGLVEHLGALSTLAGDLAGDLGGDLIARLPHPVPAVITGVNDTLAAVSEVAPVFSLQLDAVVREVSAQRLSLQALSAELAALDSQLAVLERSLAMVQTWARDVAAITRRPTLADPVPEGPVGS